MITDTWEIVKELDGSYLLLSAGAAPGFAEKMMIRGRVEGLLPMGIYQENPRRYRYDISGRESLLKRTQSGALEGAEIRSLLRSIYRCCETMEHYLLKPSQLVLEPGFIYAGTEGWSFCAHPERQEAISEQLQALSRFFLRKSNQEDPSTAALCFELFRLCHEDHVTMPQILNLIEADETRVGKSRPGGKKGFLARLMRG